MKWLALVASFLLPAVAFAQVGTAPVVIIHAGALLDRPGSPPRGPSSIVIEKGLISRVDDGFVAVPANAQLVDLRDRFVLPGLIDSHVHLGSDAGGNAQLLERLTSSGPANTLRALLNARKTLLAGFTTVRNLGDRTGATLAIRDASARGEVDAPRIVDAGMMVSTTSGHMDATFGLAEDLHASIDQSNLCDGADSCSRAVRLQVRRGVDTIKIAITAGVNSPIGTGLEAQMFGAEVRAIFQTARLYGKRVAVHAHGTDGINMALREGAGSIEHGTVLDDESIRLLKKTGAYLVPTLSVVNGYLERLAADPSAYAPAVMSKIRWRIEVTGKNVEKAYPAGVRIAFGTDAGVSRHGRNADEFELLVKHGMPPAEAIKTATVNAADLLGLSSEIGTIEPGKRADIIAVSGNPIGDVRLLKAVDFVMKDGRIVKQ